MYLIQTNVFQFQLLKETLRSLRPKHFFGSVIVMPYHALKASNVLLIHAIIQDLTICVKKIMRH